MVKWLKYVEHQDVDAHKNLGWKEPNPPVSYPRLDAHGTTMEYAGETPPPPLVSHDAG